MTCMHNSQLTGFLHTFWYAVFFTLRLPQNFLKLNEKTVLLSAPSRSLKSLLLEPHRKKQCGTFNNSEQSNLLLSSRCGCRQTCYALLQHFHSAACIHSTKRLIINVQYFQKVHLKSFSKLGERNSHLLKINCCPGPEKYIVGQFISSSSSLKQHNGI